MTPAQTQLTTSQQYALITLLALSALPHIVNVERGVMLFFGSMLVYRTLAVSHRRLLPGRLLLLLLTMAGVASVLVHYPILFGREAGVALLVAMLALKLVEMRVQRDVHILIFIGYFVLITQFLYNESSWLLLYVMVLVLLLTALLINSQRSKPDGDPLAPLLLSGAMLLQAIPVAIALFVLFPRFSSPLWHLGSESAHAVTGISGEIQPGSISRLSRSSAIAFRVDFDAAIPPNEQRYWRGPVFWRTDGAGWSAAEARVQTSSKENPIAGLARNGPDIDYTVTIEPSSERWLYALDLPVTIPSGARLLDDYQLLRHSAPSRRLRYRLSSVTDYHTGPLTAQARARALQLPPNITPRMRDLVAQWRAQSDSDAQLVADALDFFRNQDFYYTLYPPEMRLNPSDQFLFESRRGFCEHYATSFTLLMRIAGIPARVVGGYLGGEINPLGDYLIVRQSDAHAWAEVWLPETGWQRIDPTAAVAPERIERPLDPASISSVIGAPIRFIELEEGLLTELLRRFRWGADALNASWHRWVLGYSQERQHYLLRLLGLEFLRGPKLGYAMIAVTALVIAGMAALLLLRGRQPVDPVQRLYLEFCRRLARRGVARKPYEGPKDFAERVNRQRPELTQAVAAISGLYIGIRYGQQNSRENLRRLARLVKAFRP